MNLCLIEEFIPFFKVKCRLIIKRNMGKGKAILGNQNNLLVETNQVVK